MCGTQIACAMRCPVLIPAMLLPGHRGNRGVEREGKGGCYTLSSYGAIPYRPTDFPVLCRGRGGGGREGGKQGILYVVPTRMLCDFLYGATHFVCDVPYGRRVCCYAMSSTERAYGTITCMPLTMCGTEIAYGAMHSLCDV
eukprot:3940874-Rhodomonas_salina.1